MIACDASQCPYEWFHLPCVGLEEVDGREAWFCPVCSVREQGVMKVVPNPPVASGSGSAVLSLGGPTGGESLSTRTTFERREPQMGLDPRSGKLVEKEKEAAIQDTSVGPPLRAVKAQSASRTAGVEGHTLVDASPGAGRNARNERKTVRRKR